jgi:hypothetical protein
MLPAFAFIVPENSALPVAPLKKNVLSPLFAASIPAEVILIPDPVKVG